MHKVLEIASGSRPLDLCWDVSDEGNVTSLDVLMILQKVCGHIDYPNYHLYIGIADVRIAGD